MTLPAFSSQQANAEIAVALHDLAELVGQGVPGCDSASISLLTDDEPSTVAASHERTRAFDDAQYGRGSGPCVTAMREGREVTVSDYAGEDRWPDVVADLNAAGVRSSLSLPLSQQGQVIGGLNLYAGAPASFTAASRSAAEAFARQAVVMLGYLQQLHTDLTVRMGKSPAPVGLTLGLTDFGS